MSVIDVFLALGNLGRTCVSWLVCSAKLVQLASSLTNVGGWSVKLFLHMYTLAIALTVVTH